VAIIPAAWKKRLHISHGAWKESQPDHKILPFLSKERELVGKDETGAGEILHNEGAGA
jgi:hypothetical protein